MHANEAKKRLTDSQNAKLKTVMSVIYQQIAEMADDGKSGLNVSSVVEIDYGKLMVWDSTYGEYVLTTLGDQISAELKQQGYRVGINQKEFLCCFW